MTHSPYFNGTLYTRMAEDLHLGGLSERTHAGYLRAVRKLADYCQTPPDTITEDQLRRFFLHMKNELNYAYGTLRVAFSGIKFFYTRTCKRDWRTLQQMKLQHIKSLPEVITRRQVLQIVASANTQRMSPHNKVGLDSVRWLVWLFLGWTYWLGSGHAPQQEPQLREPLRCAACGCTMHLVGVVLLVNCRALVEHSVAYLDSG